MQLGSFHHRIRATTVTIEYTKQRDTRAKLWFCRTYCFFAALVAVTVIIA